MNNLDRERPILNSIYNNFKPMDNTVVWGTNDKLGICEVCVGFAGKHEYYRWFLNPQGNLRFEIVQTG